MPSGMLAALAVLLVASAPLAADIGDFDPFVTVDLSAPGSVTTIADPTGEAPTAEVYSFAVPAGWCSSKDYDVPGENDCKYHSSRSSIYENVFATKANRNGQPAEAWYGWSLYLPGDFKFGTRQNTGLLSLAYWHNKQCPHLAFVNLAGRDDLLVLGTSRSLGGYDCAPGPQFRIADLNDLLGHWSRFEVFVHWASDASGEVKVYLDGAYALHYRGPTLTAGLEAINYFVFGAYLCCTADVAETQAMGLLYAAVKRAATRDGLYVEEDRPRIRALQEALNRLGCDVGAADGVAGRKTRDQAFRCRDFGPGVLPDTLSASGLERFVAAYSSPGAAALPANPALAGDDVARISYPADPSDAPAGLVHADYVVHATESQTHTRGSSVDVNSSLAGSIEKYKGVKAFDVSILGSYDYAADNFSELSFFFEDDADPAALAKCDDASLQYPDGSYHAQIVFQRVGDSWLAGNAACLEAALPAAQGRVIAFLAAHFADVAVGMVRDGGVELLSHEGLKHFIRRVALGELSVRPSP